MTQRKLGYAVLRLGIGMAHADAAYASDRADLVAVCDLDEKRLAKAQKKYAGVTTYTDFEELLKDDRVECISICLPSAMHADFAVRAMEAGKHVLVEKPLDITPERARLIEEARARTGRICGVVHQNRFNLDMYPIREAVESGRMGKLILMTDDPHRENEADLVCTLDRHIYDANYVIASEEKVGVHFIAPASHPLAGQPALSVEALLNEPFLLVLSLAQ